jgi:hypothetical protein
MYALLASGAFGNTIPQFFSVAEWKGAGGPSLPFWGVRTLTPGGPCRLNCPAAEVEATAENYSRAGHAPNISVMISSVGRVTWLGDVWDSPGGLACYGHEHPGRVHDWRVLMRHPREWRGLAARHLLERHLNPASMADLRAAMERWPGHVVELSAMGRNFGTVPGRNAVVWEVRAY